jgi:mannosyl-oligosaccharide alpha-1,2-mannosidase
LRYRRYRVFLLAAAVTTFLFFRLNQPSRWQSSTPNVGSLKEHLGQFGLHREVGSESAEHNVATHNNQGPDANESSDRIRPPTSPTSVPKPIQKIPPNRPPPKAKPTATRGTLKIDDGEDGIRAIPGPPADDAMEVILAEGGEGRWPQDHLPPQVPDVRWSKLPEHYPVPTESVKPLPTGALKKIPKIQHKFGKKSAEAEKERQQKLAVIKEAFSHAWNGYKGEAWGKDELLPVSGGSKNTFNGWAATLVDSLDTMWIMGLEGEFEEALEFVKNIDFQTSARPNIPLFETTIRYLGGLLGAYDVSGGKYKVLLDKAEELGEVLMGAFDTPNRMPLTYYHWRP